MFFLSIFVFFVNVCQYFVFSCQYLSFFVNMLSKSVFICLHLSIFVFLCLYLFFSLFAFICPGCPKNSLDSKSPHSTSSQPVNDTTAAAAAAAAATATATATCAWYFGIRPPVCRTARTSSRCWMLRPCTAHLRISFRCYMHPQNGFRV